MALAYFSSSILYLLLPTAKSHHWNGDYTDGRCLIVFRYHYHDYASIVRRNGIKIRLLEKPYKLDEYCLFKFLKSSKIKTFIWRLDEFYFRWFENCTIEIGKLASFLLIFIHLNRYLSNRGSLINGVSVKHGFPRYF